MRSERIPLRPFHSGSKPPHPRFMNYPQPGPNTSGTMCFTFPLDLSQPWASFCLTAASVGVATEQSLLLAIICPAFTPTPNACGLLISERGQSTGSPGSHTYPNVSACLCLPLSGAPTPTCPLCKPLSLRNVFSCPLCAPGSTPSPEDTVKSFHLMARGMGHTNTPRENGCSGGQVLE